jgi:hypothetical protein
LFKLVYLIRRLCLEGNPQRFGIMAQMPQRRNYAFLWPATI